MSWRNVAWFYVGGLALTAVGCGSETNAVCEFEGVAIAAGESPEGLQCLVCDRTTETLTPAFKAGCTTVREVVLDDLDRAHPQLTQWRLWSGADVTGDGTDDILVNGTNGPTRKGVVLLIDGATQETVQTWVEESRNNFGAIAAFAPDLDGDGLQDVVFSTDLSLRDRTSFGEEVPEAGYVMAFSTGTGELLWSVEGADVSEALGYQLYALPDLDGDGVGEVFAANASVTGEEGRAPRIEPLPVVLSGSTGEVLELLDLDLPATSYRAPEYFVRPGTAELFTRHVESSFQGEGPRLAVVTLGGPSNLREVASVPPGGVSTWTAAPYGDVDFDGDLDVLTIEQSEDRSLYAVQAHDLLGPSEPGQTLALAEHPRNPTLLPDMNGDGLRDVVVDLPGERRTLVLSLTGETIWETQLEDFPTFAHGDFNRDGRADLLFLPQAASTTLVFIETIPE